MDVTFKTGLTVFFTQLNIELHGYSTLSSIQLELWQFNSTFNNNSRQLILLMKEITEYLVHRKQSKRQTSSQSCIVCTLPHTWINVGNCVEGAIVPVIVW
jgi:hypothetical protein